MLVWEFDFTIYVHFQPKCINSCNVVGSNRAKQVRELLNKHFEQEVEQITYKTTKWESGRKYTNKQILVMMYIDFSKMR